MMEPWDVRPLSASIEPDAALARPLSLDDLGDAADRAAARGALARYRSMLTASSRRAQHADLTLFARFLPAISVDPPAAIRTASDADVARLLQRVERTPATIAACLNAADPTLRLAAAWGRTWR